MNASVPCFRTDLIKTLTLMQPRTTSRENLNRPDGTVVNEPGQSAGSRNASPRILGAARAIAAREGAGKVTIEAVAKEAGLSKGGVLYNFPTKKALLSSLLDQMLAAHRELLANVPVRHPARTLTGHLETVIHSKDVDDDLSMAILAAAASDVAGLALCELKAARKLRSSIPKEARPALLLGVLVESYIGRIRHAEFNVFDPSIGTSAGLATARLAYRALIGRY